MHTGSTFPDPFADDEAVEADDHRVVSLGGWRCDVCGREVNGQTDENGSPSIDGDAVYHTGD